MPLIQGKSKKAFSKNVEAEMHAGKPQDQSLAIAYSIKRKNAKKKASGGMVESGIEKSESQRGTSEMGSIVRANHQKKMSTGKASSEANEYVKGMTLDRRIKTSNTKPKLEGLAEGGEVSAKNEKRPMPDNKYDDAHSVSRNSGNKPPKDDQWLDQPTVRQAQKPSPAKPSRPRLVGSDAFSVRYRDEIDQDEDRMASESPASPEEQPKRSYDEEGPDRQGPKVSDMEDEHSTHRKPYAKGGQIERSDSESRNIKMRTQMEPMDDEMSERERMEQNDHMSEDSPSEDEGSAHARMEDEEGQDRQGPEVPDMEDEHSSGRKPYYMGGPAVKEDHPHEMMKDAESSMDDDMELNPAHDEHSPDDSEDQPQPEEEQEHHASIAAAIMAKRERMKDAIDSGARDLDEAVKMAEGGEILDHDNADDIHSHDSIYSDDSDQVDLKRNADEDANEEDQLSYNALRKENYSESEGLRKLDSPEDSNEHGDDEESDSENKHDMISSIRRKMNVRRQFKED